MRRTFWPGIPKRNEIDEPHIVSVTKNGCGVMIAVRTYRLQTVTVVQETTSSLKYGSRDNLQDNQERERE